MVATPLRGIQDILYHILAHLEADLKPGGSVLFDQVARQTLARLARVHSSFTRPTLSVLWRYLRTDKALLHLLTVFEIAQESPRKDWRQLLPQDPAQLDLCGTLDTHSANWLRFQRYASLVQEITLDPFVSPRFAGLTPLQHTVWCQLSSALGTGTPILPRLRTAAIVNLTLPFMLDVLDMGPLRLLNPSIRAFSVFIPLTVPEAEAPLRRTLADILSSLSNLESLSVQVPLPVLDIGSLCKSHPRLRRLQLSALACHLCAPLDSHQLATIAGSLRSIEHLSVTLNAESFSLPSLPSATLSFPTLRSLGLCSPTLTAVDTLIARMHAPHLQSFDLVDKHEEPAPTCYHPIPSLLRTLVAKCPHLTAFSWTSTGPSGTGTDSSLDAIDNDIGEPEPELTLATLLAPLLPLRALRDVALWFWGPVVPYTPADLRVLAEAWPALEVFDLSHEWDRDPHRTCAPRGSNANNDNINIVDGEPQSEEARELASHSSASGGADVGTSPMQAQSQSQSQDAIPRRPRYADPGSILCFARSCPRLRELRLPTVRIHSADPEQDLDSILIPPAPDAADARAGGPLASPTMHLRPPSANAFTAHSNSRPVWPCTVTVQWVLCPDSDSTGQSGAHSNEAGDVDEDEDVDRGDALLRKWMEQVLPSASVSLPFRIKYKYRPSREVAV